MKNCNFYGYSQVLGPRGHIVNSVGGGQVGPRTLMANEVVLSSSAWSYYKLPILIVQAGPSTTLSYGWIFCRRPGWSYRTLMVNEE